MNYEQVKQAFIKADDLAQKGDAQAKEDAAVFAQYLKSHQPEPEQPSLGKRLLGGAAAGVDAINDMALSAAGGLYGLAKGGISALQGGDFLGPAVEGIESMPYGAAGRATGTIQDPAYQTAMEALDTPMAAGRLAGKGIVALSKTIGHGDPNAGISFLEHPESDPLAATAADVGGTLVGGALGAKAGRFLGEAATRGDYVKPEPLEISKDFGQVKPDNTPVEYPRQGKGFREGEDITSFYPEGISEPKGTIPQEEGIPYELGMEKRPIETTPQGQNVLQQSTKDILRDKSEQERMAAWEKDAMGQQYPEDLSQPLEYGLSLEDQPLREEARLNDQNQIYTGRKMFPSIDIDLLPERVAKDSHIKGLITKYNNKHAELTELYRKANELGLEGTRVRTGEVGMTKKAKAEINALRDQIDTIEKQLNNTSYQIQARMTNKHGVDVEGLPLFKGVKEKSDVPGTFTKGKYAQEELPSLKEAPQETKDLFVQKTEPANMQRSPDANVTGAEMVQKTQSHPLGGAGKKQGGAIDPSVFGEGLAKLFGKGKTPEPKPNGTPKGPITTHMLEETRSLDKFWEEESPNASGWTDIPATWTQKLLQGRATAALFKKANPIVRYVVHKTISLDRESRVAKENALWGDSWRNNFRGWAKRVKDDSGAITFFERGKADEVKGVHEALIKYDREKVDPTEDMLRSDGLNDRQIKAVQAVHNQVGKLIDAWNEFAEQNGKEPIKKMPGYVPHVWFGDYRVFIQNEKGELIDVRGFNNVYAANKFKKEISAKLPEGHTVSDPRNASKNKYKMSDISAFRYAMEVLSRDSPQRDIIEKTFKDVVRHRGFRTHGLQRKGAEGFAGSEITPEGTREMQRAIEVYLEQGYNFIANQKKRMLLAELQNKMKSAEKEGTELPPLDNTKQFVGEYVEHSTGALENTLQGFDNVAEKLGDISGFGPSAVRKGLKNLSGFAGFMWLTTPKNFVVQATQPIYNWAKLRNIKLDYGSGEGATKVMMKAYKEVFVKPSEETKALLSYAKQNGFVDAKTLELVNAQFSKAGLLRNIVMKGSKYSLGWWEQEVVRTPSLVMYNEMLKDVIPDKETRWQTAGALTDQYMVDYGPTETPTIYAQAGLLGEGVKPLKQYSHAYYGTLAEMIKIAADDKQYSPLGGMLIGQTLMSGLKGLPVISAIGAAINYWNKMTNDDVETPEEFLLSSGVSDTWTWGPLSKFTGIDMSNSIGAPGIEDFSTMSSMSILGQMLPAANYGMKALKGTDTRGDLEAAVKGITPLAGQGFVEKAFTDDRGRVLDPKTNLPGDYERTPGEQIKRMLSGGTLTEENINKARIRAADRKDQQDQNIRSEIMKKFVNDIVYENKGLDKDLIKKYQEHGGDMSRLNRDLKQFMIKSIINTVERKVMSAKGAEGLKRLRNLDSYKLLQSGKVDDDELIDQYKIYGPE